MIRGTTPTHIFNIPFDTSAISKVRVIYAQNDKIVFVKETNDCVLEEKAIKVTLSQAETLEFDRSTPVEIQLRVLTTTGTALASVAKKVGVAKLLENEVFA